METSTHSHCLCQFSSNLNNLGWSLRHWWIHFISTAISGPKRDLFCVFLQVIPTVKGPLPLPTSIASGSSMSSPFLMPSHISPYLHSSTQQCTVNLPPLYHKSGSSTYFGMDTFDPLPPPLDSLDSLTISDYKTGIFFCYIAWLIMVSNWILYILIFKTYIIYQLTDI